MLPSEKVYWLLKRWFYTCIDVKLSLFLEGPQSSKDFFSFSSSPFFVHMCVHTCISIAVSYCVSPLLESHLLLCLTTSMLKYC